MTTYIMHIFTFISLFKERETTKLWKKAKKGRL